MVLEDKTIEYLNIDDLRASILDFRIALVDDELLAVACSICKLRLSAYCCE